MSYLSLYIPTRTLAVHQMQCHQFIFSPYNFFVYLTPPHWCTTQLIELDPTFTAVLNDVH